MAEKIITFIDIFTLALAKTKATRFSSDSRRWCGLFYDVCRRYRERIPELNQIFSEDQPYYSLMIEKFREWFAAIKEAKLVRYTDYRFFNKKEEEAQKIINKQSSALQKYAGDIDEISRIIERMATNSALRKEAKQRAK